MATVNAVQKPGGEGIGEEQSRLRGDNAVLLVIAGAIALLHVLTNGRYGFHRDEL